MSSQVQQKLDTLNYCIISTLLLFGPLANAAQSCSEDWICIQTEDYSDYVNVYAQNKAPYPASVSLALRTTNLVEQQPIITKDVLGNSRILMMRLNVRQKNKKYGYKFWFDWAVGLRAAKPDDYAYQLPYPPGQSYAVLQGFGSRFSHTGLEQYAVDFNMKSGTPVHAAREGVVARVVEKHNKGCWEKGCGNYANYIVILHSDGTTGEYYHLQQNGALVEVGNRVERGQHIGFSGNTGHTTMPHLHFAVYRPDTWGKTESLPFKFEAMRGMIRHPRSGARYIATPGK